MIIKMSSQATEGEIQHVINRIQDLGCKAQVIKGVENTVIGVVGNSNQHRSQLEALAVAPGVDEIIPVAHPFKLVSLQFRGERTIVNVNGVQIGGGRPVVIAGPCSVESREQLMQTARAVKKSGAHMLRGGAYKPRTSPYDFQGLGIEALEILKEARKRNGPADRYGSDGHGGSRPGRVLRGRDAGGRAQHAEFPFAAPPGGGAEAHSAEAQPRSYREGMAAGRGVFVRRRES